MDSFAVKLAREIYGEFMVRLFDTQEFSIFLCGGSDPSAAALRSLLGRELKEARSRYRYRPYYPEDMFLEVSRGHVRSDMLALENLLARSVHSVVILLGSPGTFAELGAFANHDLLRDKLVVLVNRKYRKDRSFINVGPIAHLRRETKSKVHFVQFDKGAIPDIARQVMDSTREVGRGTPPDKDLTNPVWAWEFYLALIYVLDPIPYETIAKVAGSICPGNLQELQVVLDATLNVLVREGSLVRRPQGFSTTRVAERRLVSQIGTYSYIDRRRRALTGWRLRAMNTRYRRRKGFVGGSCIA